MKEDLVSQEDIDDKADGRADGRDSLGVYAESDDIMNWPTNITAYNKFIVAAVGLAITLGWIDTGIGEEITGVLTALAILLVPNQ